MKLILLENNQNRYKSELKTIELFGLSRSGKTFLLKKLIQDGKSGILNENISFYRKLLLFLEHFVKNPMKTSYVIYKTNINWIFIKNLRIKNYLRIFLLRNSYLAAMFAKYEVSKECKKELFIEEFLIQSLQIIFHKKSSEKEILRLLKILPRSYKILLIESSEKVRYQRIKNTRFPGEQVNKDYAVQWMKNTESNYKIIKKILLKNYGPIKLNPKF